MFLFLRIIPGSFQGRCIVVLVSFHEDLLPGRSRVVPESFFKQDIELAIPSVVYRDLIADNEKSTLFPYLNQSLEIKNECDPGWMYKDLLDNDLVDMSNVVNVLKVPHLIWPSDSF